MSFERILVANRGEIACRVLRSAAALGYRTVAVYSEADAGAPHVAQADDARCLGPPPATESYLNLERVIEAARASGSDAVHPGYGFLAENADFAAACAAAGLTFIGPPAEAIRLMGDKAGAKRRLIAAGVPCVPGYQGEDQSDAALTGAAEEVGYPLLVKAAAGGGGRGMRLVSHAGELAAALAQARSEAANAFGSDALILERALERPRHVEFQVFADDHGAVIHLGERDCSVQRRHQKIIEEAPCPIMTDSLRARMGAAAVEAARSIGYRGAGTVEFLLAEDGEFYFLEMNTRLQVEHPVTEMITGLDLVALQIRVAEGRPLGLSQDQVHLDGHAIEARLYAEDPERDFLPCTGTVELWRAPAGPGIRVDAGVETGTAVSPHYDPLVAKIVAHGPTRDIARRRLIDALGSTALFGPASNRDFLIDALGRSRFAAGQATTAFIDEAYPGGVILPAPSGVHVAAAAVLQYLSARDRATAAAVAVAPALLDWGSNARLHCAHGFELGGRRIETTVIPLGRAAYRVEVDGQVHELRVIARDGHTVRLQAAGHRITGVYAGVSPTRLDLALPARTASFCSAVERSAGADSAAGAGAVTAPMHGVVQQVFVKAGDAVRAGDRLLILEAMKMQHELRAPIEGVVAEVRVAAADQVAAAAPLIELAPAADEDPHR